MKRIFSGLLVALCVSTGLMTAPAAAQRIDSPYRFVDTNQFGGMFARFVSTADGRLAAGPHSALALGATWGIRVSGPLTLGVELSLMPTKRTLRDTAFVAADDEYAAVGEADMMLLAGMGIARINITGARTWNSLQPFLTLGGGIVMDVKGTSRAEAETPTNVRYDFGTSFAGQFGAGVEWFPTTRVSLRAEGGSILWKLKVPEAFLLTTSGSALPRSEWERNSLFSAGVSFHF